MSDSLFYTYKMSSNPDEQELGDCLAKISWNIHQCDANVGKGLESLEDLEEITLLKEVSNLFSMSFKLVANHGRVCIVYALVCRLKGLIWQIKDHEHRDQVADKDAWDLQTYKSSTDYMDMEDARTNSSIKIEHSGKLKRMVTGSNGN